MKVQTLASLAGTTALILAGSAEAAFTGLQVDIINPAYNATGAGGGLKTVYQVSAKLGAGESVIAVFSDNVGLGNIVIENWNQNRTALGGGFYNPGGASSQTSPTDTASANLQNGTWFTIGLGVHPSSVADNTLSVGIPAFITGNALTIGPDTVGDADAIANDGAWTLTPGDPQGLSQGGKVLIMQLTVPTLEGIKGFVNVRWANAAGQQFDVRSEFTSQIPAPGAFALLGLAGLVGGRRRRA